MTAAWPREDQSFLIAEFILVRAWGQMGFGVEQLFGADQTWTISFCQGWSQLRATHRGETLAYSRAEPPGDTWWMNNMGAVSWKNGRLDEYENWLERSPGRGGKGRAPRLNMVHVLYLNGATLEYSEWLGLIRFGWFCPVFGKLHHCFL